VISPSVSLRHVGLRGRPAGLGCLGAPPSNPRRVWLSGKGASGGQKRNRPHSYRENNRHDWFSGVSRGENASGFRIFGNALGSSMADAMTDTDTEPEPTTSYTYSSGMEDLPLIPMFSGLPDDILNLLPGIPSALEYPAPQTIEVFSLQADGSSSPSLTQDQILDQSVEYFVNPSNPVVKELRKTIPPSVVAEGFAKQAELEKISDYKPGDALGPETLGYNKDGHYCEVANGTGSHAVGSIPTKPPTDTLHFHPTSKSGTTNEWPSRTSNNLTGSKLKGDTVSSRLLTTSSWIGSRSAMQGGGHVYRVTIFEPKTNKAYLVYKGFRPPSGDSWQRRVMMRKPANILIRVCALLCILFATTDMPLAAGIMDAEKGIRFLQQEMHNKGIEVDLFDGETCLIELRLYTNRPSDNHPEFKLIEITSQHGSAIYMYDDAMKLFKRISGFARSHGNNVIIVDKEEYRFVCSIGAARVYVD
jgi:hypothetical protein